MPDRPGRPITWPEAFALVEQTAKAAQERRYLGEEAMPETEANAALISLSEVVRHMDKRLSVLERAHDEFIAWVHPYLKQLEARLNA